QLTHGQEGINSNPLLDHPCRPDEVVYPHSFSKISIASYSPSMAHLRLSRHPCLNHDIYLLLPRQLRWGTGVSCGNAIYFY
ncbi:hypothetical protein ACVBKF_04050, partial [Shewanella sp. 0m-11]